jgi:selenocysteine-specific elongation factor
MEKSITVGIAGHVDHGKTSLVRTLTGIDTDRMPEEKERGLSIEPGVAPLRLPGGGSMALMDVPGHRDFLKNTIRGLSGVDLGLLVVAADDGVMPQTLDHLEVLHFLKAQGGLVVISKTDLVDRETVTLAELEIRETVKGTFLEGKPMIPFSALTGEGAPQILQALRAEMEGVQGKSSKGPFRLWIDQVRTFPGFGTVVSGTVQQGIVRQDDALQLFPSGKEAKARFLEVHHRKVPHAVAGQRVGINVTKTSLEEVKVGMLLATAGTVETYTYFNAELTLLPRTEVPLLNRQRVKLFLGTTVRQAMIILMTKERLLPGESDLVQFRLLDPLAALPRDPFVITPMNQNTIIGGGLILTGTREKFRAAKAEKTVSYLKPLQQRDLGTALTLYIEKYPYRAFTVEDAARETGFDVDRIHQNLKEKVKQGVLLVFEKNKFFSKERFEVLKENLMAVVRRIFEEDPFKLSATPEEMRVRLEPSLDPFPFQEMLNALQKENRLIKVEGLYRIPEKPGQLSARQEKTIQRLLAHARQLGLESFSAGYFCKLQEERLEQKEVQRLLDYLYAQKKLIRLNDNRFLTPEALEEIKKRVREVIREKGQFTIQDIKGVFGYGRTHGIPVLEHLDTIGFTRRIGDARVLVERIEEKGK